jgi:sugar lactone lactonase YvrE
VPVRDDKPGGLTAVTVDADSNLFIARSSVIYKIDPNGVAAALAGTAVQGYSGDGGPSISAQLNNPQGLAADSGGNLFVADTFNSRIRKISRDGTITTAAGGGSYDPFFADGVPATNALLALGWTDPSAVGGVEVDGNGNLYIAETGRHRIRKVSPDGIISTVAGNGTPGYEGNSGPAVNAQLSYPLGVAVDVDGNLFIADSHYVRKVSADGIITIVAGSDSDLSRPFAVAVDDAGNLFIANWSAVRRISPDGAVSIVAGGGELIGSAADGRPATQAKLYFLCGMAVGAPGNLFIADCNGSAHKVSADGIIHTMALPDRGSPRGAAVDQSGNAYFPKADGDWDISGGAERIYKVSPDGNVTAIAGAGPLGYSGDGGLALEAELSGPAGVAVDKAGNVYFADTGNGAVRVLQPATKQ